MQKNLKLLRKRIEAIGIGFLWFINLGAFALAFGLGPSLVLENDQPCKSYRKGTEQDYTVGDFTVMRFSLILYPGEETIKWWSPNRPGAMQGTFKIVNGIF